MSLCVCLTQLSYKRITCLKCPFFLGLETGSFSETGKRLIVNVYECLRGPSMLLLSPLLIHAGGGVLLLRRICVEERKGVWRRRIYRKYASCRWLKNAGLEFTRGRSFKHVTWSSWPIVSPRLNMWASAIFVGTSGIPPKIIYRSVKSYKLIFVLPRNFRTSSYICHPIDKA